jgi:hypothetical protein
MIKVKDERGLVRDPSSKAILRTDAEMLREHRRKKKLLHKMHEESSKVAEMQRKMDQQATEISELKKMLQTLIDHQNK